MRRTAAQSFEELREVAGELSKSDLERLDLFREQIGICPDCGKQVIHENACPKCGGRSWVPAGGIRLAGMRKEMSMDESVKELLNRHQSGEEDFTRATEVTPEVEKAIDDAFEYHPWGPEQVAAGRHVRTALATAVKVIVDQVPPGPDRTVAIRKIREARMDANSAITHGGKY